ncbi:hypothetical protein HYH96_18265 [Clostridium botulinum]|uniref:Uncharacterized protein n=1 Tax=Clostridium botulinum (strain Okra / Type B1) TaxID=498213 RepID=B1INJ8_CLOBK|nr:hypothetical protein [Clostridium botulinum]EKX79663.1 hypothetical protein CFSAN001628_011108 [Clostridium botulinum CFSAN001628]ACA46945.1 hypothetical protein CLD_A0021 [Clostridium botulinum B1 str. Okra]MBD5563445.1 hypothetical protein [Clostridium botulinum]MBD5568296.1 hypothetical protein [Clostridium botulinum]MBD5572027.1 hypothetical protein [Clostridium botulinum]
MSLRFNKHIVMILCWSFVFVASVILLAKVSKSSQVISCTITLEASVIGMTDHILAIRTKKKMK